MKKRPKTLIFTFFIAAAGGLALYFLHRWLPNPIFALVSPVRESVWEHVKPLFYPLLAVSLLMGRGGNAAGRAPWLLSQVVVCAAMLGAGYCYHIALRGESMAVDLALYAVLLAAGFLLPRALWPLCRLPGAEKAALALSTLLGALIVWFTYFPPSGALFAGLGGALRTFLTIPV